MSGERNELACLGYHDITHEGFFFGDSFEVIDLSGDGLDEIVAHRRGTPSRPGAVFVWQGGGGLAGDPLEAIFSRPMTRATGWTWRARGSSAM